MPTTASDCVTSGALTYPQDAFYTFLAALPSEVLFPEEAGGDGADGGAGTTTTTKGLSSAAWGNASEADAETSAGRRAAARARHLARFSGATLTPPLTDTERKQRSQDRYTSSQTHVVADAAAASARGCFVQVVKETALCFMALNGQADVRAHVSASISSTTATTTVAAPLETLPLMEKRRSGAASSARLLRQEALIQFTQNLLTCATEEEQKMRETIDALRATTEALPPLQKPPFSEQTSSPVSLAEAAAIVMHIPSVPLEKWTGRQHYGHFMTCGRFTKESPASQSTRAAVACAPVPWSHRFTSSGASRGAGEDGMKYFQQPDDLAQEVKTYWQLHAEAAARARLRALRNKDTDAFAEHVSLLKISTLLGIMEKTHDFMMRIGLRLKHNAEDSAKEEEGGGVDVHAPTAAAAGGCVAGTAGGGDQRRVSVEGVRSSNEYQRFKAYVASSKGDFRLVHQVDVFVETQPEGLRATLLPHQMDGLRFLMSLHANRINGILADEMGVGKTIQTLAFLLALKERRQSLPFTCPEALQCRPHLVLAPLSVVREWREACEQFVPTSMRVATFHELDNPVQEATGYDIVLMPIHSARVPWVQEAASRIPWGYLVVDEAHKAVANLHTQTARAILRFPYERRLVLTGTPLNSDLQELWSLLHFLNPEVFTDGDSFDEVFRRPFATYEAAEMELSSEERGLLVLRLHQILRPFMLRRTKRDVDTSLKMTFHTVHCPLTAMQTELLALLRDARRTPTTAVGGDTSDSDAESVSILGGEDADEEGPEEGRSKRSREGDARVLKAASRRRYRLTAAGVSESTAQLLCNHAFLLPFFSRVLAENDLSETLPSRHLSGRGASDCVLASSGKFLVLHLLLSRLFLAKRKAVLFTHWLDCVDLLREYLVGRGWAEHVEVLTGSTSEEERKAGVRRFREDDNCLFFILSVKAGGCGINLQAAHVVVMLDRDYTTTNEDQALARVYRIGQQHTVRAVYFTTHDPAEHRVADRAATKNKPRQAIIEDGDYQVGSAGEAERQEADDGEEGEDGVDAATNGRAPQAHPLGTAERSGECEGDEDAEEATTAVCEEVAKISPASWTEYDQMTRLWEASAAAVARGGGDDSREQPRAIPAEQLALLRSMVCALDDLVLTESDPLEGGVRALLAANVPAQNDQEGIWPQQTATTAEPDDCEDGRGDAREGPSSASSPTFWSGFWRLWQDAQTGPPLLREALHAAIENDRKLHDPVEQRRRREQRRMRREKRLQRLVGQAPPDAWFMECWERGIEDEEEICKLYEASKRTTAAIKEAGRQRREERLGRREERKRQRAEKQAARALVRETARAPRPTQDVASTAPRATQRKRKKKAIAPHAVDDWQASPPEPTAEDSMDRVERHAPSPQMLTDTQKGCQSAPGVLQESTCVSASARLPEAQPLQVQSGRQLTPPSLCDESALSPLREPLQSDAGEENSATMPAARVSEAPLKRPRGRPRRDAAPPTMTTPTAMDADGARRGGSTGERAASASPTQGAPLLPAKRKRSRPRSLSASPRQPLIGPKRPRGRPRKLPRTEGKGGGDNDDPGSGCGMQAAATSPRPRRRGRPPKRAASPTPFEEAEEDSSRAATAAVGAAAAAESKSAASSGASSLAGAGSVESEGGEGVSPVGCALELSVTEYDDDGVRAAEGQSQAFLES